MSDPLGLSVGTTNLVAARVGNQPVTRRSVLTLARSGAPITGFVERVGDRIPLVAPDGTRLPRGATSGRGPRRDGAGRRRAVGRRGHRGPGALESVDDMGVAGCIGQQLLPLADQRAGPAGPDAVAALTALQANPGITVNGVVALFDFGGSGTSITLANAASAFDPIGETLRYPDFSGDLIDQALLTHVLDNLAGDVDPAGTAAVESLTRLREECRLAKERLSAESATQLLIELRGYRNEIRLTRDELQDLIRSPLGGVISALDELAERNGITPTDSGRTRGCGRRGQYSLCDTTAFRAHPASGGNDTAAFAQRRGRRRAFRRVRGRRGRTDGCQAAADAPTEPPPQSPMPCTDGSRRSSHRCHRGRGGLTRARARRSRFGDVPRVGLVAGCGRRRARPLYRRKPLPANGFRFAPVGSICPATGPIYRGAAALVAPDGAVDDRMAAVIAIIAVGGVAYALTSASESTKATEESKVEPPKQPEPEPPPPPKESPEPPPTPAEPPPPPPVVETVTEAPPPPPEPTPTTTQPPITTTRTTTTTSPTTTTTSPTTTTTTPTTTTTTTTTPSMTTSYITVPFVPVPVPIQVPNQGPVQQPPQYQQPVSAVSAVALRLIGGTLGR